MADIEDSEARQHGRGERRPGSVANFKVADFKAHRQRAWPTSRPAGCVADVLPVQAVAKRKHERKGAGAEVEEVRAGRTLSAPTTQHPRRRSQMGNTQRVSWQERCVRSMRQFLLQEDVSSGLSARQLDPRRRRAETGFAAGLDWDGVKQASARFSQVAFLVSSGPFFF